MTSNEWTRLKGTRDALRRAFRPSVRVTSRRSAKHNSVGKVFRNSRVKEQVWVEKQFNHPSWTSWPSKQWKTR